MKKAPVCRSIDSKGPSLPGKRTLWICLLLVLTGVHAPATDYYVATNSAPSTPYANWHDAAANIFDVMALVSHNDTVWVSNGTYNLTSQIAINKTNMIFRSLNGRDVTCIDGNFPNTTNRCFNISGRGSIIDGFTITNGYAINGAYAGNARGGGGIIAAGEKACPVIIRNCTVSHCKADSNTDYGLAGAGIWTDTGVVVSNCVISFNTALTGRGGGVSCGCGSVRPQSLFINCTIFSNTQLGAGSSGGGGAAGGELVNCVFFGND